MRFASKKEPLFVCPAFDASQHSVHIDGNKKLYRFSKVQRYYIIISMLLIYVLHVFLTMYRGSQKSYYSNEFIADNCFSGQSIKKA